MCKRNIFADVLSRWGNECASYAEAVNPKDKQETPVEFFRSVRFLEYDRKVVKSNEEEALRYLKSLD